VSQQTQSNVSGHVGVAMIIAIPILIVFSVWLFICWVVAKATRSFIATKVALYPVAFVLGNFFGVMPFICLGWLFALFTANTPLANYVVGKASELSLLSSAFGDPITVPVQHIIIYQFFIWLIFMRPIADVLTTVIYNSAQEQ